MKCSRLLVSSSPLPVSSPTSLFLSFTTPDFPFSKPLHILHPQTLVTTTTIPKTLLKPLHFPLVSTGNNSNNNCNNNNNNGNNNSGGGPWWWWWNSEDGFKDSSFGFILCLCFFHLQLASSAFARSIVDEEGFSVWEVKGSKWVKLICDFVHDEFAVDRDANASGSLRVSSAWKVIPSIWMKCRSMFVRLMLPEGYPQSVTSDYLDYSLWRGVQGVASQISAVLATQALLYAVGLGKGAIPTAAAINWVLKDGIGYLSKIMLSKYGRHFDVHPKGWRLFADFLENAAFGLEMSTPAFPHMFVFIGAVAGASRSAATLIQAATRSCFYAGFAARRNFAEVIAKGEAQGMVSKFIGIMLGIALANNIGSSTALALACFGGVTWIHMFCNLKSYQSIQLRTLNPYRASLVFSEYLLSGLAPPVKEVNDEEPLFPAIPFLHINSNIKTQSNFLSSEAKEAAAEIERRLQLGSKLSDIVESKDDAVALINLYVDEGYILAEEKGRYCVVLKENCSPPDMLKSLFQVNYLYWLERNAGITARSTSADCTSGGRLQISLEYVQQEFNHVKDDSISMGWTVDGLVARPLPNRVRTGNMASSAGS